MSLLEKRGILKSTNNIIHHLKVISITGRLHIAKKELMEKTNISKSTISKMNRNENCIYGNNR